MRDYFAFPPGSLEPVLIADVPTFAIYEMLAGLIRVTGAQPDVTDEAFKERLLVELTIRELGL